MFLSQLKSPGGDRVVAARENDSAWIVPGARSTRDLALAAIAHYQADQPEQRIAA